MSRFNAPPPNGDSRKMIEQRAREATRPRAPEKKGTWPFPANQHPQGADPSACQPAASTQGHTGLTQGSRQRPLPGPLKGGTSGA
ncbi:MAG: hypothetical protein H7273_06880 [Polaromonas sp.]|nr:hypothetical protein [Polaromonas sp.]